MASTKVEDRSPAPIVGRRTGLMIAAAFVVANASNYSFQIIAGRQLSVDEYGILGGFMAVITVITVSTSALQVVSARAIAAGETMPPRRRVDGLTTSALKVGLVITVIAGITSPLLSSVLRVGIIPVLMLAVYVVPACLDSIAAGRLQGTQRFRGLAAYSTAQAVTKVTLGAIVLVAGAKVQGLLGAVIIGASVIAILGLRTTRDAGNVDTHILGSESRRSFAALALFWFMLSIDVPMARIAFDGDDAGLYAAGSVLGKAVLWLPIVVAQLVFPALASSTESDENARSLMRRARLLVLALSVCSVIGLYLFGDLLYGFLYGSRYAASADIAWKIGLAVVPVALVNLLMLQLLARKRGEFLKWFVIAAVVEVIALRLVPPTAGWYATTIGVTGTILLIAVVMVARSTRPGSERISLDDRPTPGQGVSLP